MTGFSKSRLNRIGPAMQAAVERGDLAGYVALAARDDEIHVEMHGMQDVALRAPMQRDTIFRIASMTKAIAAAAVMILIEEARLRLDDPVDHVLPELASRRVLRQLDSALDDTRPADRAITPRDLLTFTFGMGFIFAAPGTYPVQKAIADSGLTPGPYALQNTPDEYMARLGGLPLLHQPGEKWHYHTGSDVLGVLIARASGMPFAEFLSERIFAPLGMKDTAFHVPHSKRGRFATAYEFDTSGALVEHDKPDGRFATPPSFPSGGGGLVSTVDDYLAFARMILHDGGQILSRPSIELMTSDALTPAQKAASQFTPGFFDSQSWGFGAGVATRRTSLVTTPGLFFWSGGLGTLFTIDRAERMVTVFLGQRAMRHPDDNPPGQDFQTLAYQAIQD